MLTTVILFLILLWALGYGFAGATLGSLLHILLVVALVILVFDLMRGRGPTV